MSNNGREPSRLWVWLLILFSTAVLLRATYSLEMGQSFEFRRHDWRQTDMRFFRDWARQIRDGDWASQHITVPRHSWLVRIQKREAWKRWLHHRFYQAPGYSYLLAFFLLWTSSLWPFFLFQMLLGVGTIALTFLVGRRLFHWRVGLLAAIAVMLYGPLLYLEPILLRSTLIAFVGLWLLWLTLQLREHPSFWRWSGLGLVIGFAVLCKATFVFAIPLAAWFARPSKGGSSRGFALCGAGLLLGLSLSLSPLLVRNITVGASPWAFSANGPLVFVQGNAPDGKPFPHFSSRYLRKVFLKVQGKLLPTIRETLAQHTITSFLSLHAKRLWTVLRREEVPNNTCYALARQRSQILALLGVDLLLLIPLGLLGLFFCFRGTGPERWAGWLLLGFMGLHSISWIWGGHLMRYRVPIVPLLAISSAFSLHKLLGWIARKEWKPVAGSVVSVVLLAFLINAPSSPRAVEIRHADYMAPIFHDLEISRFHDVCDVATLASTKNPKRYSSFQSSMCRCLKVYQQCGEENCRARVVTQCKKRFFSLMKQDRRQRKSRRSRKSQKGER